MCLFAHFSVAQLPSQRSYYEDEKEQKEKKEIDRHNGVSIFAGIGGSGLAGPAPEGAATNYGAFNKVGLKAGLGYTTPISDQWDFRAELFFMQKGAAEAPPEDAAASGAFNQARIALNCLELPTGVRYHMYLGEGSGALSNHISTDLLLTGGGILSQAYSDRQTDGYQSISQYSGLYMGYIFGVNYHLNNKIILTFRWNNSLTPVRSSAVASGTATLFQQVFGTGLRSQSLGIQVEYNF
jgi:hypothetical protein